MATDTFSGTTAHTANDSAKPGLQAQVQPHLDKAKSFVKANKWASYTAAGVIGLALLNTLRGR
ncbi:hypothetical protein [Sphingomonas jatrophae]|uniref:Uncharacterized protein n=1 Tax=Sphingomonas jatrophae TaxID=1166337 RepID=A0A1I6L373_9SPHN|nr:hypothetical protein [Sphingomonas jatrophae]SFR97894.1 hypothetical protein SAMN05192580_2221 [Sphingomonas jatrophae]